MERSLCGHQRSENGSNPCIADGFTMSLASLPLQSEWRALGINAYYYYCQYELHKFHQLFICSSHGYDLRDFRVRSTVPYMYALKWAAYITTVLSLIGAIKSLYEQTKGVVLTVKNSLSSSTSELPLKE